MFPAPQIAAAEMQREVSGEATGPVAGRSARVSLTSKLRRGWGVAGGGQKGPPPASMRCLGFNLVVGAVLLIVVSRCRNQVRIIISIPTIVWSNNSSIQINLAASWTVGHIHFLRQKLASAQWRGRDSDGPNVRSMEQ